MLEKTSKDTRTGHAGECTAQRVKGWVKTHHQRVSFREYTVHAKIEQIKNGANFCTLNYIQRHTFPANSVKNQNDGTWGYLMKVTLVCTAVFSC